MSRYFFVFLIRAHFELRRDAYSQPNIAGGLFVPLYFHFKNKFAIKKDAPRSGASFFGIAFFRHEKMSRYLSYKDNWTFKGTAQANLSPFARFPPAKPLPFVAPWNPMPTIALLEQA